MTTTFEVVDTIYSFLDTSPVKTEISGSLCKHRRDGNSRKEDIVINCLPINNEQLQKAIANINAYVPDLKVTVNGMQDLQPNHPRLKAIAGLILEAVTDKWGADYNLDVQQQVLIQDPESGSHYINIRVEFFIENL